MGDHLFEVGGVHVSRLEDMRLITGAGRYTDVWALQDGRWQCVAAHVTRG